MAFTEEERREQVVGIAASQLGPQDPDSYWAVVGPELRGRPHDVSWCGGFALACLHQAGLTTKKWTVGRGFLLTPPPFPVTNDPRPGDIAYFDKPLQHHAIVVEATSDTLITIDGNQGKAPDEIVAKRERPRATAGAVFYSIKPLIDAAIAREALPEPVT